MNNVEVVFLDLLRCVTLMGVLSGCGGSGGETDFDIEIVNNPQSPHVVNEVEPYFSTNPTSNIMEDPYHLLSQVCTDTRFQQHPMVSSVIPVNINNDGYTDFIFHYWCSTSQWLTEAITDPTPNVLIAQVSDGNGDWYIDNYNVFGKLLPSIGGASRKFATGDFNNDGVTDIAFAVNWEDMRQDDTQGGRWDTEQTVLLSNLEYNGFDIVRVGTSSHGHAVTARPNSEGYDDVLFAGFLGTKFQAYRFNTDTLTWDETTMDYPEEASTSWAIDISVINDTQIVSGFCEEPTALGKKCGLGLYEETADGWIVSDTIMPPDAFQVYIDGELRNVVNLNGLFTVGIGTDETCALEKVNDSGRAGIAVELWGEHFDTDLEILEGQHYSSEDLNNYRELLVYEIDDGKFVDNHPVNVENYYRSNYMECSDLNRDGYTDIYMNRFNEWGVYGNDPLVYINNNGVIDLFKAEDENTFPDNTDIIDMELEGGISRLLDFNGDDLPDLFTYSLYTDYTSSIEVYTAYKPMVVDNE